MMGAGKVCRTAVLLHKRLRHPREGKCQSGKRKETTLVRMDMRVRPVAVFTFSRQRLDGDRKQVSVSWSADGGHVGPSAPSGVFKSYGNPAESTVGSSLVGHLRYVHSVWKCLVRRLCYAAFLKSVAW